MQKTIAPRVERRRHRRFAIDLNVQVSYGTGPAHPYRMRDYCESGLLLVANTKHAGRDVAYSSPFSIGQLVEVSGNVLYRGEPRALRVTVEVVRLVEDGFGARFQRLEPGVFELLQGHTLKLPQQQAAAREPQTPRQSHAGTEVAHDRFRVMLERLTEKSLSESLCKVLANAEVELLDKFNKSCTNFEEQEIFTDLSTLDMAKSALEKHLLQPLLKRAIQGSRGDERGEEDSVAGQLSLVDKEDFENWVQVAKATTRLDDVFAAELHELSELMRALPLDGIQTGDPEIPFSPQQITEELSSLSVRLELGPISHQQLLQTAVQVLSQDLGVVYAELKTVLRDLGAKPDANTTPRNPVAQRTPRRGATTADAQPSGSGIRTTTGVDTGPHHRQIIGSETDDVPGTGYGAENPAIGTGSLVETQPAAYMGAPATSPAVDTQPSAQSTVGTPAAATGARVEAPDRVLTVSDLSQLLPRLQAEALAGPPVLQERLRRMAAPATMEGIKLAPAARERAMFAGELLDFLTDNYRFSDQAAPLLEAVQVPLVRAILTEPNFFQSKDHPVLRLVDQLEHLGSLSGKEQDSKTQIRIQSSIEEAVARLRESNGDERTLLETAQTLSELNATQSRDYQFNVERLVATCSGQDRLQLSRIEVGKELNHRYGGHRVPVAAVQLLDVGWRALLELVFLRDGGSAPQYRQYFSLFDNLVRRLGGEPHESKASPIKNTELLSAFEEGLSSTSFDPLHRTKVVESIKLALMFGQGKTGMRVPVLVNFPDTTAAPDTTSMAAKEGIPDSAWQRVMYTVNALAMGDRVNFADGNGGHLTLRVAWISEVDSRLTLVNQQGIKAREISQAELARSLHFGQASTEPGAQTILSERVVQDMLKRMEERLSYHTSHDSLTGLYNRPQFQNALEKALNENGRSANQVLCWMNLDNFAVFNDTCGYDVGDKLLVTVAGMLDQHFGQLGVLGHLGGDKFAALLQDCSPERGADLAETFRSAVERIPFYWSGRSMPVSVSVALVDLAEAGDNLTQLMQAADAALTAAKQARGNQVYRYSALDHKIREQRASMQWMLQVNQALDHGRLKLRCQRIAPIDPEKGFSPHYEILLGVTDESGKSLHIGNFISAAEKYNRMAQVDRWVVSTAISWVAEQKHRLAGLGGFAINLSGHTLDDEGFVAFVDDLLRKTRLPSEYISFEVTETLAIANLERASRIINALQDLGCTFALDDFGSGLSSYSYLKVLPVDYLKIDGAFVKDIHADKNNYAVVKSINEIAHFMGKRTIAEYVENAEIVRLLAEIGVDYAQGYGIEKPRLLEELIQGT